MGAGFVTAAACGSDGTNDPGATAVGGSGGGTTVNQGGGGSSGGGDTGCTDDTDCDGGVCNDGQCCADQASVCGSVCCDGGAGEVCLFESCVVPGNDCVSEADCGPDEYCEPALADDSGGTGGTAPGCTQPIEAGKCVPKPPVCTGAADDPPDCIEACEYVPPTGQLDAVEKWQWGYRNGGPVEFNQMADVWSTPAVGRVYDANCDGKVDIADPPTIVFVSGYAFDNQCANNNLTNFACRKGVLRMLDGRSGEEIFSLDEPEPGSQGYAGTSVAIGDVDGDQKTDVVALSGEGKVVVVDGTGQVTHISTETVDGHTGGNFGWGGAISLGDMDNDGWPEIAYGRTVFTMQGGALSLLFQGTAGFGGLNGGTAMSHFVDLDGDGDLELLAGNTAYDETGAVVWQAAGVTDGFTAVADFDNDALPEVVVIRGGNLTILEGATGQIEIGPHDIPGNGNGGPPTVADFNGDGQPEIGVAMQNFYTMMKPDYANGVIIDQWSATNHDNSSSVTGSSVFDFQGDGKAEVVYMDECFLWVYDGTTGDVIYSANSQSFTATEASIVADVDGDGNAEIVVVHNGANPNSWTCAEHTTGTDGYPVWSLPAEGAYRGITVLGGAANSWVGTRTLWNQHAYNVTNVCDPRDGACTPGSYYGQIPTQQQKNWTLPWLNNFRQNVQDGGLFDAPDPVVRLDAACASPVPFRATVRNLGLAGLPAGIEVGIYRGDPETLLTTVQTTKPLLPGQSEVLEVDVETSPDGRFQARILVDPNNVTFNECRPENNDSEWIEPPCVQ
ncbi:MAG: VCBS repeat-containing protein [Myxococcota bacterium]